MTTINSPLLVDVFGQDVREIGEVVKNFNFKNIVVGKRESDAYLHTELAPSFGGPIEKELLKKLDDKLKIMIAGTLKSLSKVTEKTWKETMSHMMQNVFLVPDESAFVDQADKLVKESRTSFKLDGSGSETDIAAVEEVKTWFDKLIRDKDVIENTQLDFDVLSQAVAQAGSAIESFFSIHEKKEYKQPLIDIGVLRFPDAKNPYFKLYHIEVVAWVDSTRTLWIGEDMNGLTGKFTSKIFRPRDSIIDQMTPPARANAIALVDEMIDSLGEYSRSTAVAAAAAMFD